MAALTVKGQGLLYLLIAIVQKNKLDSYKFFLVALYLFACSKEYYASRFNKNKNLIDMKNIGFEKLIILILILLAFKSCKKDDLIIDNNKKAVLLKVNDSDTLTLSHSVKKLKWLSDNPTIATVNNSGILTALKPGIALITVSSDDGKLRDTCVVTVVKITNYNTTNGLLSNFVKTISTDGFGNIWVGTIDGVSKFDGTNWTSLTKSDGLADNNVNFIYFDNENNIWFCTGGGVSEFNGTTWTTYTTADGLADNMVFTMTIDNNGNKWFGTYQGLSKFNGTNWTSYTTRNGLTGYYDLVFGLITDKNNNNIWAITNAGVSIYNGYSWSGYSTSSNFGSTVYGIFVDRYNNKWLATIDGIFEFDGANWIKAMSDPKNTLSFAHNIIFDNQDNIWFTTSKGIFKYDGNNISTFKNENFQLINKTEINFIAIDRNENVWIAKTFEGVFRLETK
jgi:ligand-binding sensor domain-containing protein